MQHSFHGPNGRRIILKEMVGTIEQATGAVPVEGFARIVELGDAREGSARMAGFMEKYDHGEWLLPLSAEKPLCWETGPVPATSCPNVCFVLSLGFGNGSPLPQPSGQWDVFVNDRKAVSVRVVNHSQVWEQGEARLAFAANRLESAPPFGGLCLSSLVDNEAFATFGPALLIVPTSWLTPGTAAQIRVQPVTRAASTRWFHVDRAPRLMESCDIYRAIALLTDQRHPRIGDDTVYFGDIHTHSGQEGEAVEDKGCGIGSREDNYAYARNAAGLDFYALTDHEWQVGPTGIDDYLGLADARNEPGRFVCLPGFEFTNVLYGHRNVYFRDSGGTVVSANPEWRHPCKDPDKCLTPQTLWAELQKTGVPFMTVPHHPSAASHPCTWEIFNPTYDRLVEVYSAWGSSEYYGDSPRGVSDRFRALDVREALGRGYRLGLIGSSDGHDGHPGNAQSPLVKHHHLFHFCGSGRAAVLCRELTREAVFDALHARRCYATTGTPIVLDVTVNGAAGMGQELAAIPAGKRPQLRVACVGTNGIDHIRVVRNGQVAHTQPVHGAFETELEWEDPVYDPDTPTCYYVRVVQKDRESAWSSPVWLG